MRATGQNQFALFAESEDRFFIRIADAQSHVLRDKNGKFDRLLWHQNGVCRYCPRVP